MHVVEMREFRGRDTLKALSHLMAMAIRGELEGLAVCARDAGGKEHIAFTGAYKDPAKALNASVRMSVRLTQLQDEHDAAVG